MANPTLFLASLDDTLAFTDTSGSGNWTGTTERYIDGQLVLEPAATNLVTNPWMAVDTTGYAAGSGSLARVTTHKIKVASIELTASGADCRLSFNINPIPGGNRTHSAWIYHELGSTRNFRVRDLAQWTSGDLPVPDGVWTFIWGTGTTAAESVASQILLPDSVSTEKFWVGYFGVHSGTTPFRPCPDIDSAGDIESGSSWTGTAHASRSSRTTSSALVDQDGTNRIDPASGAIAFRYKRLIDTGAEETILTCGTVGSGTDYLEIGVDSSDHLYMEWNSDNAGPERVTSTGTISVDTEYFLYFEWDGTSIGLSIDNGTIKTDTRDAVEGDWGAGELELVA